jgi:hypothetical protein
MANGSRAIRRQMSVFIAVENGVACQVIPVLMC